jgi:hypothetical protein
VVASGSTAPVLRGGDSPRFSSGNVVPLAYSAQRGMRMKVPCHARRLDAGGGGAGALLCARVCAGARAHAFVLRSLVPVLRLRELSPPAPSPPTPALTACRHCAVCVLVCACACCAGCCCLFAPVLSGGGCCWWASRRHRQVLCEVWDACATGAVLLSSGKADVTPVVTRNRSGVYLVVPLRGSHGDKRGTVTISVRSR